MEGNKWSLYIYNNLQAAPEWVWKHRECIQRISCRPGLCKMATQGLSRLTSGIPHLYSHPQKESSKELLNRVCWIRFTIDPYTIDVIVTWRSHRFHQSSMKCASAIIIHRPNISKICSSNPYCPFEPAAGLQITLVAANTNITAAGNRPRPCCIIHMCPRVNFNLRVLWWQWLSFPRKVGGSPDGRGRTSLR